MTEAELRAFVPQLFASPDQHDTWKSKKQLRTRSRTWLVAHCRQLCRKNRIMKRQEQNTNVMCAENSVQVAVGNLTARRGCFGSNKCYWKSLKGRGSFRSQLRGKITKSFTGRKYRKNITEKSGSADRKTEVEYRDDKENQRRE